MIDAERSDADLRPFRIDMPQADLDDLQERSSRPCCSSARVPTAEEAWICKLRPRTGRNPRIIAVEVGWPHSTVHQVAPRWPFAARAGRAVLRPGGGSGRLQQGEKTEEACDQRLVALDRQVSGVQRLVDPSALVDQRGQRSHVVRGDTYPPTIGRCTRENPTNRRIEVLLEGKNAVLYGGGGKVGGAVARAFAREGGEGPSCRSNP